jgi:hypothetical protein
VFELVGYCEEPACGGLLLEVVVIVKVAEEPLAKARSRGVTGKSLSALCV